MKTYFIIEHKEVMMFRGEPLLFNGEKCYRSKFVQTRYYSSSAFGSAKRFATRESAQKYIDKWLSKMDGEFIIKGYDY